MNSLTKSGVRVGGESADRGAPKALILIPAFNEAAAIGRVIQQVHATEMPVDYQILVIDDGSSDGTAKVARDAGARTVSRWFASWVTAMHCGRDIRWPSTRVWILLSTWMGMASMRLNQSPNSLRPFVKGEPTSFSDRGRCRRCPIQCHFEGGLVDASFAMCCAGCRVFPLPIRPADSR